jgi:acetylornithine/succinyldiaminopimelate/putrescine aminotransferase
MKRLNACDLAVRQGARLTKGLLAIPKIESVRGAGLLLGAQLADGIVAGDVYKTLLEKGLIVNAVNASTLRLAPPLTVSDAEIDEAVDLIAEVLS